MPARPRRQLALIVVALVTLLGVLALVDRSSSTSPAAAPVLAPTTSSLPVAAPPPTTTTAVSTVPRQILGASTGIKLLVTIRGGALSIDLDAGVVRPEPGLTNGNIIPVHGGVILGGQGSVAFFAAPFDGEPRLLALFRNSTVVPSVHSDRAWVVTSDPSTTAQEIALDGTVTVPPFELPIGTYPAGAVEGGLLLGLHGSMFVTHGAGDLRPLGPGEPIAASARTVAAIVCDDKADCPLTLIDVVSGRRRPVSGSGVSGADVTAAFSPDASHLAVISSIATGRSLRIVDVDSGSSHDYGHDATGATSLAWSTSGDWVFWVAGGALHATRSDGAAWVEVWRSQVPLYSVYTLEVS